MVKRENVKKIINNKKNGKIKSYHTAFSELRR